MTRKVLLFVMLWSITTVWATDIRIICTTDVHGCFFPYDFINKEPKSGSLARVYTYVDSLRQEYGERLILLENGDFLQGQPTCYYFNYIAREKENIGATVVNYMGYDAQALGNHDVETGHSVYDKWISEVKCPVLAANVINTETGKPYTMPYTIKECDGKRVAILGMLTPAIPNWLNENIWSGMRFEEMVSSARKWVKHLQEVEKADIIVGLFHSGREGGIVTEEYEEDAAERVAREVSGFDVIFYGHDHIKYCGKVKNPEGKDVWILDPSNNALNVADVCISDEGVRGEIVNIEKCKVSERFVKDFQWAIDEVNEYVNRPIGKFKRTVYTMDSFYGNSAYIDLVHSLQLKITGADVSINAPLLFDSSIKKGVLTVGDMFNLYKYENKLLVLNMTGKEIRKHLEMSYDLWVNTMSGPDDEMFLLDKKAEGDMQRFGFKNLTFNFDSAMGIDYTVDLRKPVGEKVTILRMSDGRPFDEDAWYRVAMNSYRANGGGELLTRGAGISKEELKSRVVYESELDLRYYLMQEIERMGTINPKPGKNWKFIPEKWVKR